MKQCFLLHLILWSQTTQQRIFLNTLSPKITRVLVRVILARSRIRKQSSKAITCQATFYVRIDSKFVQGGGGCSLLSILRLSIANFFHHLGRFSLPSLNISWIIKMSSYFGLSWSGMDFLKRLHRRAQLSKKVLLRVFRVFTAQEFLFLFQYQEPITSDNTHKYNPLSHHVVTLDFQMRCLDRLPTHSLSLFTLI